MFDSFLCGLLLSDQLRICCLINTPRTYCLTAGGHLMMRQWTLPTRMAVLLSCLSYSTARTRQADGAGKSETASRPPGDTVAGTCLHGLWSFRILAWTSELGSGNVLVGKGGRWKTCRGLGSEVTLKSHDVPSVCTWLERVTRAARDQAEEEKGFTSR